MLPRLRRFATAKSLLASAGNLGAGICNMKNFAANPQPQRRRSRSPPRRQRRCPPRAATRSCRWGRCGYEICRRATCGESIAARRSPRCPTELTRNAARWTRTRSDRRENRIVPQCSPCPPWCGGCWIAPMPCRQFPANRRMGQLAHWIAIHHSPVHTSPRWRTGAGLGRWLTDVAEPKGHAHCHPMEWVQKSEANWRFWSQASPADAASC